MKRRKRKLLKKRQKEAKEIKIQEAELTIYKTAEDFMTLVDNRIRRKWRGENVFVFTLSTGIHGGISFQSYGFNTLAFTIVIHDFIENTMFASGELTYDIESMYYLFREYPRFMQIFRCNLSIAETTAHFGRWV